MNCPRDNALLCSERKGQLEINACQECNGFSVLLRQDAAKLLEKQLQRHLSASGGGSQVETLVSPYNGEAMQRFLYRGIQLDYCSATHSIWFDRGEYSKMFQSPELKRGLARSDVGEKTSKAWDVVGNVVVGFDALDVIGEVVGAILTNVDTF